MPDRRPDARAGAVSLEAALGVTVLLLLAAMLLQVVGVGRGVLLVHEAARAGARAAATGAPDAAVAAVARDAADGLDVAVTVRPAARRPGDLVTVEVGWTGTLGPLRPEVAARSVVRVEPGATP